MQKKMMFLFSLLSLLLVGSLGWADGSPVLSITGTVAQPLYLTLHDLLNMQSVTVRQNEVTLEGHSSQGEVNYRGVPLKTLLELACVQKEEDANFSKPIDLAIVVNNRSGRQTVLSWGEVLDRNPGEVLIAVSAGETKNPKADPATEGGKPVVNAEFPKLIVANDLYPERALNDVSRIEVINITSAMSFQKGETLYSPDLAVTGAVKDQLSLKTLSAFPRIDVGVRQWGEGKENQSLKRFSGVSLRKLIEKADVAPDTNTVFLVSAPDGYRSLISYGELYLNLLGERIIIADKLDNRPLEKYGKFEFVLPDDPSSGRWVKAVSKIEVITVKPSAKLYIIGVGCGDLRLLTLDTLCHLGRAEAFICPDEMKKKFARYIGEKPVLFNQKTYMERVFRNDHPELAPEDLPRSLKAERQKAAQLVKETLSQGKNVAFLDYGDPTIFGTCWRWLKASLPEGQTLIVPGLGAFNASNALMGSDVTCKGTVVITAPDGLRNNEALIKALAEKGETMALFMGLLDLPNLMPLLQKYYADTTPVAIAYNSGRKEKEKLVRTTLGDLPTVAEKETEKFMGVIYLGGCLEEDVKGYHFD